MKKIIVLITALGLSTLIYANDNTGCGLGSIVMRDQSTTALQVMAVSSNVTGSQTFGGKSQEFVFPLFYLINVSYIISLKFISHKPEAIGKLHLPFLL